jgi:hypothetical protein
LSCGYNSINHFFQVNQGLIREFPAKCGNNKSNHLHGVKRVINKPEFNETLGMFDVGACTSIIQNMFASNSKYLNYFNKHPRQCEFAFDKSHSLYKLRELRNIHFGHIFVFKMGDKEFKQAINDLEGILNDLSKVIKNKSSCFKTEISEVMAETVIDEKVLRYSEIMLKEFILSENLKEHKITQDLIKE